ncbi:hypothetical protein C1H46_030572 [Malus baccata]|uniref:Uncharacterized protein n=1 Tax=Malus baccata TaxID=106549 RepID=A0A540LC79_MALBA|nr:hypothetical protein C1H46_030572 [Malus baccata]
MIPVQDSTAVKRRLALEPTFAFGLVRHLEGVFAGKRLDDEGAFAGVVGVAYRECKGVELAGLGEDDLGQCAFFACHKLNGSTAFGDEEVLGVDVFNGLERLDHPAWEWAMVVLYVESDEDSP